VVGERGNHRVRRDSRKVHSLGEKLDGGVNSFPDTVNGLDLLNSHFR
jgi:hypothetical protein